MQAIHLGGPPSPPWSPLMNINEFGGLWDIGGNLHLKWCSYTVLHWIGLDVARVYIFHCHANPFVLGPCIGLSPQSETFALPIPTCWYMKSLVDPTRVSIYPTQVIMNPTLVIITQRELVEYRWRWFPHVKARVDHVDFMLFVSISFAFSFQWNMGFILSLIVFIFIKLSKVN